MYLNNSFQNKPDPVCVLHQMEYGFPFVIVLNMMRHRIKMHSSFVGMPENSALFSSIV